ncbi:nitrile hydratase accessory protein [Methylobacterium sp. BTF04]|uniref:nitrile hydratase accessory protein n=1 Tax=Methylobacterium sp. BTF04 TaxID=2708300 RepID=UPI0013D091F2|nr:nitrile hydratase accessory protein [Methylobacterium sp. BTF04]NEU14042.1 nitrile hydratase accessory protein [Methylobacterium sp. BTF04]
MKDGEAAFPFAGPSLFEEPSRFSEPWEAQVFALVMTLQEAGLFTPAEWARALGKAIRPENAPEAPADYTHWLIALEALLAARGITDAALIGARSAAFLRAAEATPHGAPILIENDPRYGR